MEMYGMDVSLLRRVKGMYEDVNSCVDGRRFQRILQSHRITDKGVLYYHVYSVRKRIGLNKG